MHVSANIIRFPESPASPSAALPRHSEAPAEIVRFSPLPADDSSNERAQQHGQFYAAHRIVSRIADQLDATAAL